MTKLIVGIIVIYHAFLRTIGLVLGMLTAGLWVGYQEGVRAITDMQKFMAYRARAAQLKRKKEEDNGTGTS